MRQLTVQCDQSQGEDEPAWGAQPGNLRQPFREVHPGAQGRVRPLQVETEQVQRHRGTEPHGKRGREAGMREEVELRLEEKGPCGGVRLQ